jgi:ribosomal protein S18 acetylase RimI-like enzyme
VIRTLATMSPTIAVRRFEPAQLDELAPLWLALHHHHQATTTSVPIVRDDELSWQRRRAWYERMIDNEHGFVVVARAADKPVGYAFVRVHEGPDDTLDFGVRWGQVVTLSVLPDYRGAGVGTAIMDEVDGQLAAIGVHSVEIDVMQGNDRAREFYERRGYVLGQVYLFKVGSSGGQP